MHLTTKLRNPPKRYIDLSPPPPEDKYSIDDLGDRTERNYLCKKLRVSARTLSEYRKIAYEYSEYYASSCLLRFPEYPTKKLSEFQMEQETGTRVLMPLQPDPPPFTRIEAIILVNIARLFTDYGDRLTVTAFMSQQPDFWRD